MLSGTAAVDVPRPPVARDVRATKLAARDLVLAAMSRGERAYVVSEATLQSAARVAGSALPDFRLSPRVDDKQLGIDASVRVAANTWVNAEVVLGATRAGGYPHVSGRVGAWPVPAPLAEWLVGVAHARVAAKSGKALPAPEHVLTRFRTNGDHVVARFDMPPGGFGAIGGLMADADPIDLVAVDRLYALALDKLATDGTVELSRIYAVMFAAEPAGADARGNARAAFVATAMAVVGPAARRLAGSHGPAFVPRVPWRLRATLAGRDDLARHFALSAALAVAADPVVGTAIGTFKELDDSLAGGSGFSFVDLAADRAGLRLGEAVEDPDAARRIGRRLASGKYALLPADALGLREELGEHAFEAGYGNIATRRYADAIARIDAALDTLPIFSG